MKYTVPLFASLIFLLDDVATAFSVHSKSSRPPSPTSRSAQTAGSFFNPVPEDDPSNDPRSDTNDTMDAKPQNLDESLEHLLKERKSPSRASQPSTIQGVPSARAGQGFGKTRSPVAQRITPPREKPFVGIGPPLNDITKPEYDDQGYTLYADERTGEKSRVFEALVDYPCDFTMKIVGANEGAFVEEMVAVVAESCLVQADSIQHSVRALGKWTSVTVQAPVQSAEMLYGLYEVIDRDPRVKFKF
ncbi:predicted protein [Phaeodactylum tricornutum CCAP 1055/1]|jgi:putative lipoic acid-binding regulatory protein|uniref:Uncharacterized protein n=2 Tax=Phaeodactylum tricornutum TaxID=2850 RepID=B5Y5R9_PHATC|nr:predicted protein [Phaeodactylum tricornutum CCAP 1055/1]ACI65983.1 predicted protein [Phaeodactylum tricornutum CCAP 1055/1]|eukprot:XP_002186513.1 predicted protein [Phaeodactylum tricornutum CCAP 1055/1]